MGSEAETLEEKLTALLGQLQTECGILERMVYKNKNQHRRCSYFQYLLKVRRDLRLLQSARLGEILNSCFQVITGKRPKQKIHLLESLKRGKFEVENYNFMERLLGAARLLSRMVEPMLKAAVYPLFVDYISVLLAQSFFMGFCLTILALLARIRVLVQQILLDVVLVFNMVSSLSQKKQSVKITEDGLEVFREVFPTKEDFVTLECVWKSDKFELLERMQMSGIASHYIELEGQTSSRASCVQYQSIESFLGEGKLPSEGVNKDCTAEKVLAHIKEDTSDLCPCPSIMDNDEKLSEGYPEVGDAPCIAETPSKKFPQGGLLSCSSFSSNTLKRKSASRKVAFVAVKDPAPSTTNAMGIKFKENESNIGNKEDSFFSLLSAGNTKDSLF
ncbi:hypothetical protein TorRG33x02_038190 [Trema orientale]|uniref:Nucleolus and neural progenitor protein-like N-terminal domain-containing protein n=1 Tax=Trema orientale TaxID=63057 RepID=A0A2P5FRI3_TREOI|nr:hypothetical protein TorRG33x02_038190 [Trema orientale]